MYVTISQVHDERNGVIDPNLKALAWVLIHLIEEVEGLTDTLIVEPVNDDVIKRICDDDDDEDEDDLNESSQDDEDDLNESSQDDEKHDDNDMELGL
ncbi:hypothetical protein VNO80_15709 [Phaseolus coccineus]|uniref:Uncharacterized protein n=1 Tax=Phaseolus coccineus TaxID=3886 RepID=A0AAN9MQS5_PHACN